VTCLWNRGGRIRDYKSLQVPTGLETFQREKRSTRVESVRGDDPHTGPGGGWVKASERQNRRELDYPQQYAVTLSFVASTAAWD
ncbi:MAG TPA: hypothetical protein VH593_27960, partial [Ktedonobacteraceae bacterium]